MKMFSPFKSCLCNKLSFVYQNYLKEESNLRDSLKDGRVTIVLQTNRNKDNPPHPLVNRPPKINNKYINGIENKYETKPVALCFDLF